MEELLEALRRKVEPEAYANEPPTEPAPIPPIRVGQVWRRFDGKEVFVAERELRANIFLYGAGPNWYLENGTLSTSGKPRGSHSFDLAELISDISDQP